MISFIVPKILPPEAHLNTGRAIAYLQTMTRYALILSLFLATPAMADEDSSQIRDGIDLFGEGARMIFEGLRDEMQPMLEEVQPFFEEEMLPFLQSLGDLIDDLAAYEMPERLPNGDIIIRRRPDAGPPEDIEL